jgi:hypothetical protein
MGTFSDDILKAWLEKTAESIDTYRNLGHSHAPISTEQVVSDAFRQAARMLDPNEYEGKAGSQDPGLMEFVRPDKFRQWMRKAMADK